MNETNDESVKKRGVDPKALEFLQKKEVKGESKQEHLKEEIPAEVEEITQKHQRKTKKQKDETEVKRISLSLTKEMSIKLRVLDVNVGDLLTVLLMEYLSLEETQKKLKENLKYIR